MSGERIRVEVDVEPAREQLEDLRDEVERAEETAQAAAEGLEEAGPRRLGKASAAQRIRAQRFAEERRGRFDRLRGEAGEAAEAAKELAKKVALAHAAAKGIQAAVQAAARQVRDVPVIGEALGGSLESLAQDVGGLADIGPAQLMAALEVSQDMVAEQKAGRSLTAREAFAIQRQVAEDTRRRLAATGQQVARTTDAWLRGLGNAGVSVPDFLREALNFRAE